jgi:hypothetical protein
VSNKKHAKDVRRRERLVEKQRRRRDLEQRHEFPQFVFEPNEADPAFVELVRAATATVDFRDTTSFLDIERNVYRRVKQVGAARAGSEFALAARQANEEQAHIAEAHYIMNLGQVVFNRIPTDDLIRNLPFNDVVFVPAGHDIRVVFGALQRVRGPGGTAYYSSHRPAVVVGGRRLTVAFSRHAIERCCLRLAYRWPSYAAAGDMFGYFAECLHFEVCELYGGHLAFTFWVNSTPGFWNHRVVESVLGAQFDPAARYCLRVGYCPAVIEGDFLKAKTLLFPGYASTPEYTAMLRTGVPIAERRAMLERAKRATLKVLVEEGEDLVRWFHAEGIEQVRRGHVNYADPVVGRRNV